MSTHACTAAVEMPTRSTWNRTSYTNLTSGIAGALFSAADALEDPHIGVSALRTLDALDARLRDEDGLLFHAVAPGEAPRIRRLLVDQVAYLGALLDAHEWSGERVYLDSRRRSGRRDRAGLRLRMRPVSQTTPMTIASARLRARCAPLDENAALADALLRLGTLTRIDAYTADGEPSARGLRRTGAFRWSARGRICARTSHVRDRYANVGRYRRRTARMRDVAACGA